MRPERWARIEEICFSALEREPPLRSAYLDEACGDDPELRHEVQSLLEQHEQHPSYLEQPLVDLTRLDPEPAPATGSIGPYRLIRQLGRGGMGEVYLAVRETEDLRQMVALKIIRRGMDSEEVLRRFRLERRILANLHHPNIAALLDAAVTEDGRPYFVMEHVEGLPLDEYCEQRQLPIPERLALFQVICRAVQHAHQNLIVHRDLKPGNILVTEDGTPKLLDFGIGKVLATTDVLGPAVETRTEVRLLTPEYAAPEQVSGSPVTTTTDVYALGVILYELLTGQHPYRARATSRQDLERAILKIDPTRPSLAATPGDVRRRLAGDLDTIVMMALRKEPDRRYPSPSALAADVQRYLDGLPVTARPDTFGYRAGKFIRRHTAAVLAGVLAAAGLAATTAVTLVQSARVKRESARVMQERDKAIEVRGFLMEMFGASGADRAAGDTVTARRLLDLQVQQVHRANLKPDVRATMLEVLADGYDRLGLLQTAEPLAREALDLRRKQPPPNPDLAGAVNLSGWILHELGKSKEAEPLLLEAIALHRSGGETERGELSRSLNDLGVVYNAQGRYPEADSILNEALGIRRAVFGDAHRAVGITANNLAAAQYFQGKVDAAIQTQDLALSALRASVGSDHQRTIVALANLAAFKVAKGNYREAEAEYRQLLAQQSRLQGREHPVTARVMLSLASTLHDQGALDGNDSVLAESEHLYREATTHLEARLGLAHPQLGTALDRLAAVLMERGDYRRALPVSDRATAILRAGNGEKHLTTLTAMERLALIRAGLRQNAEALHLGRAVVATLEATLGKDHLETARGQVVLCELLLGARAPEARATCAGAERLLGEAKGRRRNTRYARLLLARSELATGNVRAADSILGLIRTDSGGGPLRQSERRVLDSLAAVLARR